MVFHYIISVLRSKKQNYFTSVAATTLEPAEANGAHCSFQQALVLCSCPDLSSVCCPSNQGMLG